MRMEKINMIRSFVVYIFVQIILEWWN